MLARPLGSAGRHSGGIDAPGVDRVVRRLDRLYSRRRPRGVGQPGPPGRFPSPRPDRFAGGAGFGSPGELGRGPPGLPRSDRCRSRTGSGRLCKRGPSHGRAGTLRRRRVVCNLHIGDDRRGQGRGHLPRPAGRHHRKTPPHLGERRRHRLLPVAGGPRNRTQPARQHGRCRRPGHRPRALLPLRFLG